ncbi:MAG: hypothetical protein JW803_09475 [Endomicrobiales bacterium]|nr:hypothetical protein [Endomicrobiales bacterium]
MSTYDVSEVNYAPLTDDANQQFLNMDNVTLVSGHIKDPNNAVMSGIQAQLSGTHSDTYTSQSTGYYRFYVTTNSYTVALNHASYVFNPSSYTLNNVSSEQNDLDFSRINRAPALSVTSETGYTSDAVEPNISPVTQNLSFRLVYKDEDNDQPKQTYPIIYILKDGATIQSFSPSLESGTCIGGAVYSGASALDKVGDYTYNVLVYDLYNMAQSGIFSGSFQVYAEKPSVPTNMSQVTQDGAHVVSGQIHLCWACDNPNNDELTYTLYLSEPQGKNAPAKNAASYNFISVYTGSSPNCTLNSLEADRVYYWKIGVENQYGAVSESPVYSFSTIGQPNKAFNYPNPFNPTKGEATNIVFEMPEDGSVEISVFSEYGDIIWSNDYFNLSKGSNQISYDGKDGNSNNLYNGTYLCRVKKKYNGTESTDKLRLLVIK